MAGERRLWQRLPLIRWVGLVVVSSAWLLVSCDGVSHCERLNKCILYGLCTPKQASDHTIQCVAGSGRDCLLSYYCVNKQRCVAEHDVCVSCPGSKACKDDGRCTLSADRGSCINTNSTECIASLGCRRDGRCTSVNGRCQVMSREDCASSVLCKSDGMCKFIDGRCQRDACHTLSICRIDGRCAADPGSGRCIAATAEHCLSSSGCKEVGACHLQGGRCVVKSIKDCLKITRCQPPHQCVLDGPPGQRVCKRGLPCQRMPACLNEGKCTASAAHGCIATQVADCRASTKCLAQGFCTLSSGACVVAKRSDCLASTGCSMSGKCTPRHHLCALTSDDDCRSSSLCRDKGACFFDVGLGICFAHKEADCLRSRDCLGFGRCRLVDGVCQPTLGADCAASEACRSQGLCSVDPGRSCVALHNEQCQTSIHCRLAGLCYARSGVCVATEASCSQSLDCLNHGRCRLDGSRCRVGYEADCKQSLGCKRSGACVYRSRECIVAWDRDCRASELCVESGRCFMKTLVDRTSVCVVKTERDCRASRGCQREGYCSLRELALTENSTRKECAATADADCASADACTKDGRCRALDGRCVK